MAQSNAKEIAKKAFPSTVILVMQDNYGNPISLGSGFFVSKDIVATNCHVIMNSSKGYIKIVGQERKFLTENITNIDEKHDLVLLKIKDGNFPNLEISKNDSIAVGEEIFAIGNPKGLEGTFSTGIISGIRESNNIKFLQITAPISPGSSGGPILDKEAKVVGIAVSTFRDGQNLNFAIPVQYLRELLNKESVFSSLTSLIKNKAFQNIMNGYGSRSTSAISIENIVNEYTTEYGINGPYKEQCGFSFSFRNKLEQSIKGINYIVIFYDATGRPIHYQEKIFYEDILPGLAKRESFFIDMGENVVFKLSKHKEIRILDFKINEN
jgi:hypothetical protein